MITGDQRAIAVETARRLDLGTNIVGAEIWDPNFGDSQIANKEGGLGALVEEVNGFASVYPEHKFKIVESLIKRKHIVGMTGEKE